MPIFFKILLGSLAGAVVGFLLGFGFFTLFPKFARNFGGTKGGWLNIKEAIVKLYAGIILSVVGLVAGGILGVVIF